MLIKRILRRANLYRRYFRWREVGCIFIHVPKAAGTSVSHAIYGRPLGHYSAAEIRGAFPDLFERCFVFAIVRNPYDRLVSAYRFAVAGRTRDMGIYRPEQYRIPQFGSFHRFVFEWLLNQDLQSVDPVFRPQAHFLAIDGAICVDQVFRFEALDRAVGSLEERLGKNIQLEIRNAVPTPSGFGVEYNEEIRQAVYHCYRDDFELLGYPENPQVI